MLVRASRAHDQTSPRILVSDRTVGKMNVLSAEFPDIVVATNDTLVRTADLVFLCVPPGAYPAVLDEIADRLSDQTILVSVTNGVALSSIEERVPCPVIKLIPTVAHAVGRGVALLARGARSGETEVEAVARFIHPFGKVVEVDPADMRMATNITGCGPALLACFCQVLGQVSASKALRMDPALVEELMTETLIATGKLVEHGSGYQEIMREAATGGGMTQVALDTLREDLPGTMERMIQAIARRERVLQGSQGLA